MTRKASRPCQACGRGLAIHRGKHLCSKYCRNVMRYVVKAHRRGRVRS